LSATKKILKGFDLIQEVEKLNEQCAIQEGFKDYKVYTIDRCEPYRFNSKHMGISRVLQGFEVVLLSVLAHEILKNKCLPISLDHDGILFMANPSVDPQEISEILSKGLFAEWSNYLLGEALPIEAKRYISNGQVVDF